MKSLIVSVFFSAWIWARDPSQRFLTASYSDVNTIRDNNRVRSIIKSDLFKSYFDLRLEKSGEIRMDTIQKGWRIASSVDGQGTGDHPNYFLMDDLLKAKDSLAATRAKINNANAWIDTTALTRIANDPAFILIMQRLHELDPTGYLLDKSGVRSPENPGGWEHVSFPMRYRPASPPTDVDPGGYTPDPRDRRSEPGELLWPERWPEEKVAQEEVDLGEFGAAGQLGQRPIPLGGGLFKREWFEIVDAAPANCIWCRGWDIAETEDGGDWTRGVKMGRSGSMYYISDMQSIQATLVDDLILTTTQLDGKKCRVREGSGSGKATIAARTVLLAGYDYEASPEWDSKIERANPFRAQCQARNVKLVYSGDRSDLPKWIRDFLSEVPGFPAGKHDDIVDGCSNAFNCLVEIKSSGVTWGKGSGANR